MSTRDGKAMTKLVTGSVLAGLVVTGAVLTDNAKQKIIDGPPLAGFTVRDEAGNRLPPERYTNKNIRQSLVKALEETKEKTRELINADPGAPEALKQFETNFEKDIDAAIMRINIGDYSQALVSMRSAAGVAPALHISPTLIEGAADTKALQKAFIPFQEAQHALEWLDLTRGRSSSLAK